MTVLVTGFEAFGGLSVNTSALVVAALAGARLPQLVTDVLPTAYRRAAERIGELLQAHRPHTVLLLGLAARELGVRLERRALNLDDCEAADNDGEVRRRCRIVEGAVECYPASLPFERMAIEAQRLGVAIGLTDHAGGFVCNHVYYTAMHWAHAQSPPARCGFVHLPLVAAGDPRLASLVAVVRSGVFAAER